MGMGGSFVITRLVQTGPFGESAAVASEGAFDRKLITARVTDR